MNLSQYDFNTIKEDIEGKQQIRDVQTFYFKGGSKVCGG